jgi:hypothetical protein
MNLVSPSPEELDEITAILEKAGFCIVEILWPPENNDA